MGGDLGGYLDFLTNTISVMGTYFIKDTIAADDPFFGPFDPTTSKHNPWIRLQ